MELPLQITFRDMDPSPAVEAEVRRRAEKLAPHAGHLHACHVVVESPHKHQRHGRLFHVRVDLGADGRTIAVARNPDACASHEDVYVALRDAFKAARRALDRHVARQREERRHEQVLTGEALVT